MLDSGVQQAAVDHRGPLKAPRGLRFCWLWNNMWETRQGKWLMWRNTQLTPCQHHLHQTLQETFWKNFVLWHSASFTARGEKFTRLLIISQETPPCNTKTEDVYRLITSKNRVNLRHMTYNCRPAEPESHVKVSAGAATQHSLWRSEGFEPTHADLSES